MSESRDFGFETRMVHAGHIPDSAVGARAVPIYQTTSYVFYDTDHAADLFDLKQYGHIYSRISNPTVAVLEERVASLEGATGGVAASSGMAAQLAIFLTLLEPGDEIVSSSHLYGGTTTQLTFTLPKMGIRTTFVSPGDFDAWERAIGPKTKALYGETIGNPQGSILDIERLAALGKSKGIPLIVDNTVASPGPLPADRARRDHRRALRDEVPRRPRELPRRPARRLGEVRLLPLSVSRGAVPAVP